jgi:hypothetical protein
MIQSVLTSLRNVGLLNGLLLGSRNVAGFGKTANANSTQAFKWLLWLSWLCCSKDRKHVLTTNLDSQRGVLWNVGAIAASEAPGSLDLIRNVLAASTSVPLAFSPIFIDAQADGRTFQEMHVDGEVTTSVFTPPPQFLLQRTPIGLSRGEIYVLMNENIDPKFQVVEDKSLKIAEASLDTLATQKKMANLIATYAYTKAHHIGFNLTSIDPFNRCRGRG